MKKEKEEVRSCQLRRRRKGMKKEKEEVRSCQLRRRRWRRWMWRVLFALLDAGSSGREDKRRDPQILPGRFLGSGCTAPHRCPTSPHSPHQHPLHHPRSLHLPPSFLHLPHHLASRFPHLPAHTHHILPCLNHFHSPELFLQMALL